jgi:hypothetical protein
MMRNLPVLSTGFTTAPSLGCRHGGGSRGRVAELG